MLQQIVLYNFKQKGMRLINALKLIPNEVWQKYREKKREQRLLQELEDEMFNDIDFVWIYTEPNNKKTTDGDCYLLF